MKAKRRIRKSATKKLAKAKEIPHVKTLNYPMGCTERASTCGGETGL
jgi:hypothetical protein